MKELEIVSIGLFQLPKTKNNINRKMKNKIIPSLSKGDEIILMESSVFPPVYFKKSKIKIKFSVNEKRSQRIQVPIKRKSPSTKRRPDSSDLPDCGKSFQRDHILHLQHLDRRKHDYPKLLHFLFGLLNHSLYQML